MQIFSQNGSLKKIVPQNIQIAEITEPLRKNLGHTIVATIGTWDMLHIGHLRYLNKAKTHGDILIVGVDSDRAVKFYKGPLRPIIPQEERMEMLSYQSCVDIITLVDDINEKGEWGYELIQAIMPDVFIAVEDSYPPEQIKEIEKYCKKAVVLPRQAKNTSTSNTIQETVKKTLLTMIAEVDRRNR